jgi:hypothetical protein
MYEDGERLYIVSDMDGSEPQNAIERKKVNMIAHNILKTGLRDRTTQPCQLGHCRCLTGTEDLFAHWSFNILEYYYDRRGAPDNLDVVEQ